MITFTHLARQVVRQRVCSAYPSGEEHGQLSGLGQFQCKNLPSIGSVLVIAAGNVCLH